MADLVARAVNFVNAVPDAIYLDTNAWSMLAKGKYGSGPLRQWAKSNGWHLWMSRFQIAELCADTRLARPVAELLHDLPVTIVDRGQNEFSGKPWNQVKIDFHNHLHLREPGLVSAFSGEMLGDGMRETLRKVRRDGEDFRVWLEEALARIPEGEVRNWSTFGGRLKAWVRARVADQGYEVSEEAVGDPACYVGLKLSYGLLFHRYFVNRQQWKDPDYIDYLRAADMAYAGVVVTERGLAESLRQLAKRPELLAPSLAVASHWLGDPKPAVHRPSRRRRL